VGQSGVKWLLVVRGGKVRAMRNSKANKGNGKQGKTEGIKVYTRCASNSKPEHLGTAIAIAKSMPTLDYKGEIVDEGQRDKLIAEFIKKNGVTKCDPGASGLKGNQLSAWSRISLSSDDDKHPLDRQEKKARGNKKKKVKKK